MKKILTVAVLLSLGAGVSYATSISFSKHNLSTSGTGVHSTTQTQICIFCHSPHNPMGGPLWNRTPPTTDPATYLLYTSGSTLTAAAKTARIDTSSVSILCLSCHDGTVNEIGSRVINKVGNPMTMVDTNGTWTKSGVVWDGRTPVNHPVGFDYLLAQSQNPDKLRPARDVTALLGEGFNVFFWSTQTAPYYNSMECATCHTVHDPANSPFLRISNANNALCLACHIDKIF